MLLRKVSSKHSFKCFKTVSLGCKLSKVMHENSFHCKKISIRKAIILDVGKWLIQGTLVYLEDYICGQYYKT